MNAYKTYIQIDPAQRVVLDNLPFHPGTLVEVLVVEQIRQIGERATEWRNLMRHVQNLPQSQHVSDADIATEIAFYRSHAPAWECSRGRSSVPTFIQTQFLN